MIHGYLESNNCILYTYTKFDSSSIESKQVKILITTFTYLPNKDGVAEACRVMAEGLASLGWEVWVATSMGCQLGVDTRPGAVSGVNVVHFQLDQHTYNSPLLQDEILKFLILVREGRFDLVVNQCWDSITTRYLHFTRCASDPPFVMVSHGYARHLMDWQQNPLKGWGRWLRGLSFTFVIFPRMLKSHEKVIFLSKKKDWNRFFDHRVAAATRHSGIQVIANGINLRQFPITDEGFRDSHGIGSAPMALCVANYSDRKNQLLAVKAFREANVPGSVLVLIGSELNAYARQVQVLDQVLSSKYPSGRVLFLEKLSRQETFAAYVACDFFLLAAKAETQPIVLIEAMAAGKPWISTDTGCVTEMAGGIVCRGKNRLVAAIRRLFTDEAERNRLGKLGKSEAAAKHDSSKTALSFDAVLRETLQR